MRNGRGWLGRGLLLLAVVGCSHGSSAGREEPPGAWATEDSGIRTKGGVDSATLHIQALIAQGQLEAAEAYLVRAVAAGLVAGEAARRLQEKIAERKKQQNPDPDRRVPPRNLEDWQVEDLSHPERTCSTELPNHPVCRELPEEYSFHSDRQALEAMKRRLGAKNLVLHRPDATESGPCPNMGEHFNVRMGKERAGSIVCCPCCVENDGSPLLWKKCRIVWQA